MSFSEYDRAKPGCPECSSEQVRRRIGRIATTVGDKAQLQNLANDIGGSDSSRDLGRVMRTVQQQSGVKMDGPFNEVVSRLEKGESPASIDKDYQ